MAAQHSSDETLWELPVKYRALSHVHGALCALAVVCIFPIGAILLRTFRWYPVTIHKWVQLLGFTVYFAGLITSIILWTHLDDGFQWTAGPHGQLGLVVSICVLLQTVFGLWNHWLFRVSYERFQEGQTDTSPRRSILAWVHIFLGWFIVVGGIVNGALGINQSTTGYYRHSGEQLWSRIVYSIAGGFMGTVFCAVLGWRWLRSNSRSRRRTVVEPVEPIGQESQGSTIELREARGATVAHL